MARKTTNHEWPVQEAGDEDYETTFDNLIDQIDDEVILKDTLSNRPNAGTEGRWFLATDGPTLYYDNGNSWSIIGGRNVQFAEIENVGTIAFDTSTQDMTIVDQFDQVQMRFTGGGQVRVPNGTFDVGNDIETIGGTTIWDSSNGHVPASSVQGLSLSSDTDMDAAGTDLTDSTNTATVWDSTNAEVPQSNLGGPASSLSGYPLPNSDISNSSITVAGNSVSLGGSTSIAHGDLSNAPTNAHHSKDHNHSETGISTIPSSGLSTDAVTQAKIATDAVGSNEIATDAVTGIEIASGEVFAAHLADNVTLDDLSTSAGNYNMGGNSLLNTSSVVFSDANADGSTWEIDEGTDGKFVMRYGGSSRLSVTSGGNVSAVVGDLKAPNGSVTQGGNVVIDQSDEGTGNGFTADKVDGYDIQKNGTDGTGVINFKT